jgi:hypothetical protein
MPARVERFPLPPRSAGSLWKPLLSWAAVAAALAVIRRLTREPSLPRMSEQWLASHQHQFNRHEY